MNQPQPLLDIQTLHVGLSDGKEIIKNLNLTIRSGETHVIMGPNGAGKSTLANIVMGHPDYHVTAGRILFDGEDITDARTDERARKGLFLAFQAPEEVDGITVENFIKTAKASISGETIKTLPFYKELKGHMKTLNFDPSYAERYLNVGFSGGEKKKNEIFQMLALNPKLAILDETDSGLDVDAIKTVSHGINAFKNENNALMIISHSTKLLEELDVDAVHIIINGESIYTGEKSLIFEVNQKGFTPFL